MRVTIFPGALRGTVVAPPSKSMAHRMLICAGLSEGTSHIRGISESEDMMATLDVLTALGARCCKDGDTVTVTGMDPRRAHPQAPLPCRECGSTLRFFIPICLLGDTACTLTGSPRLMERPLGVYEHLCAERGMTFVPQPGKSLTVQGPLRGGEYTVRGDVSSQFITGLLFALPLCAEDSVIRITPPLESRSYIELTLEALRIFGITAVWQDALTLSIPGGQTYRATDADVEGDYSNAAFFDALACLGHEVTVTGLREASGQGDKVYREVYPMLKNGAPTVSIGDCPDLGPILMALAAAGQGATFTETRRLRIKESDRGAAMATELAKFGVTVDVQEDTITVRPPVGGLHAPNAVLDGHNDHRIVMALCTLLTVTGGTVDGAEAVKKSLPDYFERLTTLGARCVCCETDA